MSNARGKKAVSLIELLVACSLFLSVLAIVFFFFSFGTRAFQTASQRQGAQSQALRVMDSLQADLKRSAGPSVTMASRQRIIDGVTVQRDALNFISLKDWSNIHDSENFNLLTAQPRWNRYWTYYATTDQDGGRLIRHSVDPMPAPNGPIPLNDILPLLRDDPLTNLFNGRVPAHSQLADNVYEFKIERSVEDPFSFLFTLRFRELSPLKPGGTNVRQYDTYELVLGVTPENTFPPRD